MEEFSEKFNQNFRFLLGNRLASSLNRASGTISERLGLFVVDWRMWYIGRRESNTSLKVNL
jgi:hypothetical protein